MEPGLRTEEGQIIGNWRVAVGRCVQSVSSELRPRSVHRSEGRDISKQLNAMAMSESQCPQKPLTEVLISVDSPYSFR